MVKNGPPVRGVIFDIQRFSLHDGPGVRTLVFLKGCPLACQWCSNPESNNPEPELGLMRSRCNQCGECVPVCPEHAIARNGAGMPRIDRGRCNNCGACTLVCLPRALILYGREVTVEEVHREVRKDKLFYEGSSGGVTVSGGEPLQQPSFVRALFKVCHEEGISTCLETSGCAATRVLEEILPVTDYVLFDLKQLDDAVHERFTGASNKLILENAAVAVKSGVSVQFRCPIIPGINDTPENIKETARFVIGVQGKETALELLPYHRMGVAKYEALDRTYSLRELATLLPDSNHMKSIQCTYEELGVRCTISV